MPTRSFHRHRSCTTALAFLLASSRLPSAFADCIDDAAARYQVNAVVLRAIGWQESRLQSQALGHNANGSIDVGAFQINSVHLSELGRYGIDRAALADGCTSAEVAAWHYRRQIERQGNSWQAVGAYHSATPGRAAWYANRIATILMRWKALPAGVLPSPPAAALAPDAPSAGRTRGRVTTSIPATQASRSAPVETTTHSIPGAPASPSTPASARLAATVQAQRPEAGQAPAAANAAGYRELAYLPPTR